MVLVENELKNAYIWEYVPPYEISYDFTTWSVADLQSKWWTVPAWSSVTANGYKNTSDNRSYIKLSSSELHDYAQTATKLVMKLHWTATWLTERALSIFDGTTEICNLYWNYVANSATFGQVSYVNESISEYWQNWEFTTTFTVDIQNKTWEYVSTGHTTLTWTVTDASITSFRLSNGIWVYFQGSGYIKDMSITIA